MSVWCGTKKKKKKKIGSRRAGNENEVSRVVKKKKKRRKNTYVFSFTLTSCRNVRHLSSIQAMGSFLSLYLFLSLFSSFPRPSSAFRIYILREICQNRFNITRRRKICCALIYELFILQLYIFIDRVYIQEKKKKIYMNNHSIKKKKNEPSRVFSLKIILSPFYINLEIKLKKENTSALEKSIFH